MNHFCAGVAVLAGFLVPDARGLAGGPPNIKIPVESIGAASPKEVNVEYLAGDRSIAQRLSKVPLKDRSLELSAFPGSSEVRILADGFEPVEVSLAKAALGISLPALSQLLVKWPFGAKSKLPPSVEIHVLSLERRLASNKTATLIPGTDTYSTSLSPGRLALLLYSPGIGVATSAPIEFHPGSRERVEKFGLLPLTESLLRVTDAGGHPLPTASLRFRCGDGPDSSDIVGSWLSRKVWQASAKGEIELRSIPASSCVPTLTAKGSRTTTLKPFFDRAVEPPVLQTVILRPLPRLNLEIDRSIQGSDGAADVALTATEIDADEESSDPPRPPGPTKIWSGRVRDRETIRGLKGGLYRVVARAGSKTAGVEFRLTVWAEAPDEQTVRIRFEPRSIRGHVLIGDDPGRRITVEALPGERMIGLDQEPLASTTTADDGSFEVPVSYVGPVVLRARLSEKNLLYQRVDPDPDPEKEVVLQGWASTIIVRSFDAATGDPVPDAVLQLTHTQSDGRKMSSKRPVPGEISLTGLGPGQLKLRVSSPRHRAQEVDLKLSGDEEMPVDFQLTVKDGLTLVVTGESGEPIEACEVLTLDPMRPTAPGAMNFQSLGKTDWSGRVVLEDVPSNTVLAFLRPGYGLQIARSYLFPQGSGHEFWVALPSLREKLSLSVAQQLAKGLSGPPTFIQRGFIVPSGLGRYLAVLSGLDDQALLRAGPEALLLWSRVLPPGEYTVFAQRMETIPSRDGKEKEVPSRPNVATMILD